MLVSDINTGKSQDDATSCTHEIDEVFHTGGTGESAAAAWVTVEVNQLARSTRQKISWLDLCSPLSLDIIIASN